MTGQIWRCGVDRYFLDTVIKSFHTTGFSSQGGAILLWVLLLVLLLGLLSWLLLRWHRSRRDEPFNWIVNPKTIRRILERALESRTPVELSVADEGMHRITTSCTLLSLEAATMTLEPPVRTGLSERFVNREMRLFFGVPSEKSPSQKIYYTGSSQLLRVEQTRSETSQLNLSLPERLAVSQKREHLRIAPPLKLLGRLHLWPDNLHGRKSFEAMVLGEVYDVPEWPRLSLINLSAGGMAVEGIYESRRMLSELAPDSGSEVYLYLELTQPGTGKPEPYYLLARVRHRLVVGVAVRLGLEFQSQAFAEPLHEDKVQWQGLGGNGITALDDWVVARHLELFREHGFW